MMKTVHGILYSKEYKAKEKTQLLCEGLLSNVLQLHEFIEEIQTAKDSPKATCIEALAHASEQKPNILTEEALILLIQTLSSKAPRIKWECAKTIGLTISLYPDQLESAIDQLVMNINHEGTVVRWSIAFALGEIVKMNQPSTQHLVSLIEQQIEKEEKKSIQKIYHKALTEVTMKNK